MKVDFLYSTDFLAMNANELGHTCMHLYQEERPGGDAAAQQGEECRRR